MWLDKIFRRDMYERFEFVIGECEPVRGRSFLDVGCGCGYYCVELARRGAREVVGLDISRKMLELARNLAEREGVADVCTFVQGDLFSYRADTPFNVCLGVGLFDYLQNPLAALCIMKGLARDKLIITFPRLWTWRAPVRKLRLMTKGCPVYFYSGKKIRKLLGEAGIGDFKMKKLGKLCCVVCYLDK